MDIQQETLNATATDASSCIHPDVFVCTATGFKPIKQCSRTSAVVTSSGALHKVLEVMRADVDGTLIDVDSFKASPDHQLYVVSGSGGLNVPESVRHGLLSADWRPMRDIQAGDYVAKSIPTYEKDIPQLQEADCFIYGLSLSYGSLKGSTVTVKGPLSDSTLTRLKQAFLVGLTIANDAVTFKLPVNPSLLFDQYDIRCFYGPLMHLPFKKIQSILEGLRGGIFGKSEPFCLGPASVAAINYMSMRLGETSDESFQYAGYHYQRIREVRHVPYKGQVADMQVDAESNYNTAFGLSHNGGGKRAGSFAIYLSPWHADVLEFLELKKNHGDEEARARDLFYAMWVPDLFMKRVEKDETWSLMCPNICPGMSDVWGDDFERLYEQYESEGKFMRQIKARELWNRIMVAQIETGTPYLLFSDHVNRKSNQSNLGTIKSSNLCTEILEYSSPEEVAVCNLSSVSLRSFVQIDEDSRSYDFKKLHDVVKVMTRNLNKVIDINFYPVPEAKTSNMRHRPIGIGVQGLADAFFLMRYPFDSEEAKQLNRDIFETMYHAALEASCEIAAERESDVLEYRQLASIQNRTKEIRKQMSAIQKRTLTFSEEELTREKYAGTYDSYLWNGGCPVSKGILQYDMWGVTPSDRWDWAALKEQIEAHGVRNSLLVAPMPTASTSQILGNTECFEPLTSNIYARRTGVGEFIMVNKYLMGDLIERGLWTEDMKSLIIAYDGSIQQIEQIPEELRNLYKTAWDIKQRHIIDMAADRGAFVDQSQSMNLFVAQPTAKLLTSMHYYSFNKGLKTGQYYLRCKATARAQQFTIDPATVKSVNQASKESEEPILACTRDNPNCAACGS